MTLDERSQRVQAGGVDALVAERGAGPDVLFLHGNPDTHHIWSDLAARLAPSVRCIMPDLPGFGDSKAPRDFDVSLANQGAFVAALADALGLATFDLVVHDIGGPYGLSFAAQYPDRLRSLTIFNTSFFPDTKWHFWAKVWRTPILGELAMGIANRPLFVREMVRGSPGMPRSYASEAYDRFGRDTKRMVLRWYRYMDYPKVVAGWDERLLAATRHVRKQVIWGDLDPFMPPSTADRYEAPVHRFADAGHWAMVEKPDETAAVMRAHLAGAT
jgi:pimeloyl-ACP methyl ester carboxylesterase